MSDMVNQPPHYNQGEIECIQAIEASMTPEQFRGYLKGSILKYLWRYEYKGEVEDLQKATWYLNRLTRVITNLRFKRVAQTPTPNEKSEFSPEAYAIKLPSGATLSRTFTEHIVDEHSEKTCRYCKEIYGEDD